MHWGGGTPTFLSEAELTELMQMIRESFELDPHGEYAIEVDPRKVGEEKVALLGALGMNRISIGCRTSTPKSSAPSIASRASKNHGGDRRGAQARFQVGQYRSDLRPAQADPAWFSRHACPVIACSPDRIALYNYAHLPAVFKPQRRILDADMPQPEVKLQLMINAIETLLAAATSTSA